MRLNPVIVVLLLSVAGATAQTTLISTGATWRYGADGLDLGTAWHHPAFNDSSWPSGVAKLGFGNKREATVIGNPTNGIITYYFRRSFNVPDVTQFQNLSVRMIVDDGVVVYLNGTEVLRRTMPAGDINFQTLAVTNVVSPAETNFTTNVISSALLVNGVNLLAAEVHQGAGGNADLGWELTLLGLSSAPPTITQQPTNQTLLEGQSATFSVSANGSLPLSYQWRFNGSDLPGQTNSSLIIATAGPADAGGYDVVVANSAGSVTSAMAALTVMSGGPPPSLVRVGLNESLGQVTVYFSQRMQAVSAGDPANYMLDQGIVVVGAMLDPAGRSVTLTVAPDLTEGITYLLTVVDVADFDGNLIQPNPSERSFAAAFPPGILMQPQSQSVAPGGTAFFSVTASGGLPLHYQWYFDGAELTGETNASLSIVGAGPANRGGYSVVITNAAGSATSSVATLVVREVARVSGIIATATSELTSGPFDRFAMNAVNGVYLDTSFWESVGVNQGFGEDRDPAITFDLRSVRSLEKFVIWNSHEPDPRITRMVVEVSFDGTTFTALGEVTLTTASPQSQTHLLNGVQARYVRFDILQNGAGQLFPVVGAPTANSLVAIDEVEFFAFGGALESYALDLPAGYSLIANQLQNTNNSIATVLPSVPDGTFLRKFNSVLQQFENTVTFFDGLGWDNPDVTLAPGEGAFIFLPSPATLTFNGVFPTPQLPLPLPAGYRLAGRQVPLLATYEQIVGLPPTEGTVVDRFDPAIQDLRTHVYLKGEWRDRAPVAQVGEAVWISQVAPLVITSQPASQSSAIPGSLISFAVEVSGGPSLRYQWLRNGVSIPDATNASYNITNAQIFDSGVYAVAVQSSRVTPSTAQPGELEDLPGAVISAPAVLRFATTAFPFSDDFAPRPIANNVAATLTGNNTAATLEPSEPLHASKPGGHSIWLAWMAPGNGIVTFTTLGSSFDTVLAAYAGSGFPGAEVASDDDGAPFLNSRITFNAAAGETYNIAVDGFGGASGDFVLSWELEVTTDAVPAILAQPENQVASLNGTAQFRVVAAGVGLSYQWFRDGQAVGGATASNLVINAVRENDAGVYSVQINSGSRFIFSHPAHLQIGSGGDDELLAADKFQEIVLGATNVALLTFPAKASGKAVARGFSGTQIFSSIRSSKEPDEPSHCGIRGGKSEWFSYQATNHGILKVDTDGSSFDTVLAVYTGPGDSFLTLTEVACDNNSGTNGITSSVLFNVTSNTIYYIAIDGVNNPVTGVAASGTIHLNYRLALPLTLTSMGYSPSIDNGRIIFKVTGTPNLAAMIESATSVSPPAWTPLFTNSAPTGVFNYTNINAAAFSNRFYRAVNDL